MKKELFQITKDLAQDKITEQEARTLLLGLLGVSGSLSIPKGIEICQRWERHLFENEEDVGHIPTQENVVKQALS